MVIRPRARARLLRAQVQQTRSSASARRTRRETPICVTEPPAPSVAHVVRLPGGRQPEYERGAALQGAAFKVQRATVGLGKLPAQRQTEPEAGSTGQFSLLKPSEALEDRLTAAIGDPVAIVTHPHVDDIAQVHLDVDPGWRLAVGQ